MFGDSFFTRTIMYDLNSISIVFVPMFGDSFFTRTFKMVDKDYGLKVFVPMFGDSFFTH